MQDSRCRMPDYLRMFLSSVAVLIPQVFLEKWVGCETIGNGRQVKVVPGQRWERKPPKKDLTGISGLSFRRELSDSHQWKREPPRASLGPATAGGSMSF